MMQKRFSSTRRGLLKLLGGLALLLPGKPSLARQTPEASEGPFYPTPRMRFADADNDLVKIKGEVESAGGEVIVLKGRVLDEAGNPVPQARVEIWQCDVNGRYLHSGDSGGAPRDPAFQGFGHVVTGPDGEYAFRTIKPVPYPGRTPHIHVKVLHGGRELTSQFYIAGHALNARDGLFRRMTPQEQDAVSMAFTQGSDGLQAVVDIYV
jgi:protocatechuate 3,4-dioxygenase beta subunit